MTPPLRIWAEHLPFDPMDTIVISQDLEFLRPKVLPGNKREK
jgi:hypothetical protein